MERYELICQEEGYNPDDPKWGEISSDFDAVECTKSLCETLEICTGPGESLIKELCESISDSVSYLLLHQFDKST